MITIDELNDLAAIVSKSIKNINWGGCCCFASVVGARLREHFPVEIVVYSDRVDEDVTIDSARLGVKYNVPAEWHSNGIWFGHVVVEYIDEFGIIRLMDSDGVCNSDDVISGGTTRVNGYLTILEATELAAVSSGWNNHFDRNQLPQMQQIINDFFDQRLVA